MAQGQAARRPSPEEIASFQEEDRQVRLQYFPPQFAPNGEPMLCVSCGGVLNPIHNRNFDGGTGGFCNKLCRKDYEKKLMNDEDFSVDEAGHEVDKYESYRKEKVRV